MTKRLEQAVAEVSKLSRTEQDALADWLLAELESERQWEKSFADSQDVLSKLAEEALAEHHQGHVLGNQHWPVAVVGEQILVPVALDRAVMETVLRTHRMTDYFQIQYERRAWPQDQKDHKAQHDHKHVTHPSHTH